MSYYYGTVDELKLNRIPTNSEKAKELAKNVGKIGSVRCANIYFRNRNKHGPKYFTEILASQEFGKMIANLLITYMPEGKNVVCDVWENEQMEKPIYWGGYNETVKENEKFGLSIRYFSKDMVYLHIWKKH